MDYNFDLSEFKYRSRYTNPGQTYYGDAAIHSIALDLIYKFRDRSIKSYDETTLFSRVIRFDIDFECWVFNIHINLLDIANNIEIIAVRNDNIRIYTRGKEWYDNIDRIKENKSKNNALVVAKVVKHMATYIKNNYTNIIKK